MLHLRSERLDVRIATFAGAGTRRGSPGGRVAWAGGLYAGAAEKLDRSYGIRDNRTVQVDK